MKRFSVKTCLLTAALLAICGAAEAQTSTIVVSPTSAFAWTASPDENVTFFGTPILTNYQMNLYLKAAVTGTTEPTTTPALINNLGKPIPDANGTEKSLPIRTMINAGVEYIGFLHAVGPGGLSAPSSAIGPFGSPPPPKPAGAAVTITP